MVLSHLADGSERNLLLDICQVKLSTLLRNRTEHHHEVEESSNCEHKFKKKGQFRLASTQPEGIVSELVNCLSLSKRRDC